MEIEDAVRSGGRLVIIGDSDRAPEILITSATPLRIDIVPDSPDESGDPAEYIDFDRYLSQY